MSNIHEVVAFFEGRTLFDIFMRRTRAAAPGYPEQKFEALSPHLKATWQLTAREFMELNSVGWKLVDDEPPRRSERNTLWSDYFWGRYADGSVRLTQACFSEKRGGAVTHVYDMTDGGSGVEVPSELLEAWMPLKAPPADPVNALASVVDSTALAWMWGALIGFGADPNDPNMRKLVDAARISPEKQRDIIERTKPQ